MAWKLTDEERAMLVYSDSSVKELWPIAEDLGWLAPEERRWAAERLIEHPNFTAEALEVSLRCLNAKWYGDDPVECSAAIQALKAARDAAAGEAG